MADPVIDVSDDNSSSCSLSPSRTPSQCSEGSTHGSKSPDNNCSICLGKLQNKAFTNGCFHQFCYLCLLEWSKVKTECPLCKQSFRSIIHSVRSVDDYEEHVLTPEENGSWGHQDGQRFRYHSTLTADRLRQRNDQQNAQQDATLQCLTSLGQRRRPRLSPHERARLRRQRQLATTSDFRRSLYIRGLRVMEVHVPGTRRVRDISSSFFRSNPACTYRLVPWLNRELNVLLYNNERQVQLIVELVVELVKQYEIQSTEFRNHLTPFLGSRTTHFIHEFYHFAQCPYDMTGFDRHVVYNEADAEEISVDSSSDESVVVVSQNEAISPVEVDLTRHSSEPQPEHRGLNLGDPTPLVERVRNFLSAADGPGQSGWESPPPEVDLTQSSSPLMEPVTNSGPSQNGVMASRSVPPTIDLSDIPLPSTSSVPAVLPGSAMARPRSPTPNLDSIAPMSILQKTVKEEPQDWEEKSDSDCSGVEIIGIQKPFLERTPVHLSSESEEEVVVTKRVSKKSSRRSRSSSANSIRSSHRRSRDQKNRRLDSDSRHSRGRRSSSRSYRPRWVSRSRSRSRRSRSRSRHDAAPRRSHDRTSRDRVWRDETRHRERTRSPARRLPNSRKENGYDRGYDDSDHQRHNDIQSRLYTYRCENDDRARDNHRRESKSRERRTWEERERSSAKHHTSLEREDRSGRKADKSKQDGGQVKEKKKSHEKGKGKETSDNRKEEKESKDKHKKIKKKKHKHGEEKSRDKSRGKHSGKSHDRGKRKVVSVSDSDSDYEFIRLVHKKHPSGHKNSNATAAAVVNISDDDNDLFR